MHAQVATSGVRGRHHTGGERFRITSLPTACLASLISGSALASAFAPLQWWPLALLAVAAITIIIRQSTIGQAHPWRRGMGLGYLFGIGLFVPLVGWISVLGTAVGIGLCAAMAVWGLLVGLGTAMVAHLRWWPVATALVWSVMEFCSTRQPFGGFGWLRLAYSTPDQPLAGFLPWVGVPGVSLLVALVGTTLAWVLVARTRRSLVIGAAVVALLAVVGLALRAVPVAHSPGQVVVGVVQGNVDGTAGSHAMGYARSVTNNHLSETIMLMARVGVGQQQRPDFVLWPENSTDVDPTHDQETRELIQESVRFAEVPIFVGAVMDGPGPDERQTTGLWWTTDDTVAGRYDKRNLVPFGEWIPFRQQLLPLVPALAQVGRQSVPGTRPGMLEVPLASAPSGTLRIADIICFELAYDATIYEGQQQSPQLTVVQSNTGTYTGTAQPQQQFQITRVRAIELGRDIVVSTTNSFSGHIDASGRVLDRTQEGTAATGSYTVPLAGSATLATRIAPWVDRAAALAGLVAMVLGGFALRRVRRAPSAPSGLDPEDLDLLEGDDADESAEQQHTVRPVTGRRRTSNTPSPLHHANLAPSNHAPLAGNATPVR